MTEGRKSNAWKTGERRGSREEIDFKGRQEHGASSCIAPNRLKEYCCNGGKDIEISIKT